MKARGGERYDEISTPPPSLKLSHRLCIVPLGTSCKKSLFHKSAILAVKMTIYWISYEVQKESQENLWPIAIFFKFFLLKASVFKNSFRKKCTKRYNTDLIRVKFEMEKNIISYFEQYDSYKAQVSVFRNTPLPQLSPCSGFPTQYKLCYKE